MYNDNDNRIWFKYILSVNTRTNDKYSSNKILYVQTVSLKSERNGTSMCNSNAS